VSQLKKSLRFSEDDDGVHPVVLGSMVFPPDCYDDENPWTPLTPKNTQTTNTPRMVSLRVLFICLLFPLVQCCLYGRSLYFSFLFFTFYFLFISPHSPFLWPPFSNTVTCYLVYFLSKVAHCAEWQLEKQSSCDVDRTGLCLVRLINIYLGKFMNLQSLNYPL